MLRRMMLITGVFAALSVVVLLANQAPPGSGSMTDSATRFVGSLTEEQKKLALFDYDDDHRTKWYFTPQQEKKQSTRKGLRLDKLSDAQKQMAFDLLKSGLSTKGYDQASTIISLETLLNEFEKNGANTRNPQWYFVSIFGEPSATGKWGWRFEGHHLSVNFMMEKGTIISSTPLLFASNPANVMNGSKKGLRPLPETEDLAKELIGQLTDDQKKLAEQEKQFPEIKEGQPNAGVGEPVGLPMAKMTAAQRGTLQKLIEAYANRLTPEAAKQELARVKEAGEEKVLFAYAIEPKKKGSPYTYRIHGPTFVVEFLNVQGDAANNPANHIHSAWRRLPMDFALPAK
jgi:hypothetical protein